MRFSDPATITTRAIERITHDAAGAEVRALLGSGAASVIDVADLARGAGNLPARPLIAYREGPVVNVSGVDVHSGEWWIYDDPEQRTYRINKIAAAMPAAYDYQRGAPPLASPAGGVTLGALGEPQTDPALGLRVRRLPITIDA